MIKRFFLSSLYKGTENYIRSQSIVEGIKTFFMFLISAILFITGYITTGSRANLLTIVAVLGCLPASKSMVSFIMFMKSKGCSKEDANEINKHTDGLDCLYDCVFTSYKENFTVNHLTVRGKLICGYSSEQNFDETSFQEHVSSLLKLEGHKELTIKIFTNLSKYTQRMEQIKDLEPENEKTLAILQTLKDITL